MSLMHFLAQLGSMKVGPMTLHMPDEMETSDLQDFTNSFRVRWEHDIEGFNREFVFTPHDIAAMKIAQLANAYMDHRYSLPEDRVFTSFQSSTFEQKDFYLPTLKVFNFKDGQFYSPSRFAHWKNKELKAEHLEIGRISYDSKTYEIDRPERLVHHVSATCDCGIYGSVNVEELELYLHTTPQSSTIMLDPRYDPKDRKLCIIEPSNKSEVFIARKGWKASKAFISEIVGETMSVDDASELLSMVWNRPVNVDKIFHPDIHKQEYP